MLASFTPYLGKSAWQLHGRLQNSKLPYLATYGTLQLMERLEYDIRIKVNGRKIKQVVIDHHYKTKHSASVNDQIILQLVRQLDGQMFEPDGEDGAYTYFVTDDMLLKGKHYKLIWLLEGDKLYIGVINAYRRK